MRIFGLILAATLSLPLATRAQDRVPDPVQAPPVPAEGADQRAFLDLFFDESDGKFDISDYLSRGGFIPVPIIITEPAVDGGLGLVLQFISWPDGRRESLTRRMLGAARTGNGSYGYGYFQSGTVLDGRLSYRFGVGKGELTIAAYPGGGTFPLEYTTEFTYGVLGSARWALNDPRFSVGVNWDFREIRTTLALPGLPPAIRPDIDRTIRTGALGLGFHFDSRDNPLTPTEGVNVYLDTKFNTDAFGSDRAFDVYDLASFGFGRLGSDWRYGMMTSASLVTGDVPFNFVPSIENRGVPANRYQGKLVLNAEAELTRQLNDRWSVLGFAGVGYADARDSRLFADSGAIYSGGVGARYRIARKLGVDAGIDLAFGPEGPVIYFQFGHAWMRWMD